MVLLPTRTKGEDDMQKLDPTELEEAAFELARQLNRAAQEACERHDIYAVAWCVQEERKLGRLAHTFKLRFGSK